MLTYIYNKINDFSITNRKNDFVSNFVQLLRDVVWAFLPQCANTVQKILDLLRNRDSYDVHNSFQFQSVLVTSCRILLQQIFRQAEILDSTNLTCNECNPILSEPEYGEIAY